MSTAQNLSAFILESAKLNDYPLLMAARMGDLSEVIKLVNQGSPVNQKDMFSTTALHLAAMYGHADVASFLIQRGADTQARAYKDFYNSFTPLDLAVKYAPNAEVVSVLIKAGVYIDGMSVMSDMLDSLMDAAEAVKPEQFDVTLQKVEALCSGPKGIKVINDGYEAIPVSVIMNVIASDAISNPQFYARVMATADRLNQADTAGTAEKYVIAKDLLHAFPSGNHYNYKTADAIYSLQAEGHFSFYSVGRAAKSLNAYHQKIHGIYDFSGYQQMVKLYAGESILSNIEAFSAFKQDVFYHVAGVFDVATVSAKMSWQYDIAQSLYFDYQNGQTILLPTGWPGHAIDIIVDKATNLLMIANAGDRYGDIPSGLNAYHMSVDLTADDIHRILKSEDKTDMEFKLFYDLGLVQDHEFSFFFEEQDYGNCAWYSQTISEQALIFLDVKKSTLNNDFASTLSKQWFNEFNDFQKTTILKDYLKNPSLEVSALGDVLVDYHGKLQTAGENERANLILAELNKPQNKVEFNQYCKINALEFTPELKALVKTYGFKFGTSMFGDALSMDDVIDGIDQLFVNDTTNVVTHNAPSVVQVMMPVLPAMHEEVILA